MFERVLYIWAIRHPGSGYVQGINELVTPFVTVFLSPYLREQRRRSASASSRGGGDAAAGLLAWCAPTGGAQAGGMLRRGMLTCALPISGMASFGMPGCTGSIGE